MSTTNKTKTIQTEDLVVRELDLDLIQPNSKTYMDPEQGGSKIVVIGKPGCFAKGTQVLMFDGITKSIEDIEVGDEVMGDNSAPVIVEELCRGTDEMFEIELCDGTIHTVNHQHILSLSRKNGKIWDITVEDYLALKPRVKSLVKWYRSSVNFHRKGNEDDVEGDVESDVEGDVEPTKIDSSSQSDGMQYCCGCSTAKRGIAVPKEIMTGSAVERMSFLAGLIDVAGTFSISRQGYNIALPDHPSRPNIIRDITFIVRSLGLIASYGSDCDDAIEAPAAVVMGGARNPFADLLSDSEDDSEDDWEDDSEDDSEDDCGSKYCICIKGPTVRNIPTKIQSTIAKTYVRRYKGAYRSLMSFDIRSVGYGEYFGFTLPEESSKRFLLSDFSVVHNTGKSTLISAIMYAKKDIYPAGVIFSGTEDSNGFYEKFFPGSFIYNAYDEEILTSCIKRQKIGRRHLANPWAFYLVDDCTDDPGIFNRPLQQGIYKNSRHWKMMYILSLQYCMDVRPVIRTNVDGTFILRESNLKNRKSLYENYAGVIPTFDMFCQIMDQLTDDYTCLYINNQTRSNKLSDCIFFYKATPPPDGWKFGCPEFWEFHNSRYNPDYVPPFTV